MRATKRFTNYVSLAAVLGVLSASPMSAQRELFQWSGRVDQQVLLTMSGRKVTTSNVGPSEPGQLGMTVISSLPSREGEVSVRMLEGRGTVDVIRQPSAENGYTAVIRIRDPQGGSGMYHIEADWQPMAAGEIGPPLIERPMNDLERHVALRWSGDVDNDLIITLGPSQLSYYTRSGRDPSMIESTLNGIPEGTTGIWVSEREGRDPVVVIQQPSEENGYTAKLRIHDVERGSDHYSFDVLWR
jgi:hypothetical protein